jgi:hypothetical protein
VKRRKRVLILALGILMALPGCAPSGGEVRQRPSAMKAYPPERYLAAQAEGASQEEAKRRALVELSRVFDARVRSETMDRMGSVVRDGLEEFRQEVTSWVRVTSDVRLKGARIAASWEEDGRYGALAVLEKQKAREEFLGRIRALDGRVQGSLAALSGTESRLMRYRTLKEVSRLWVERTVNRSRLTVLGYGTPGAPYDIEGVFRRLRSTKAGMPVYVETTGEEAGHLRESLVAALGEEGFPVATERERASVVLTGRLDVQGVGIEHPEWQYARATAVVSVLDAEAGLVLGEVTESVRATHLTAREARQRAARRAAARVTAKLMDFLEQ